MPHYINKMPQCHNSLLTVLGVATKCHRIATMQRPLNCLKMSDATNATSATSKNVYVCIHHYMPRKKAPETDTSIPEASDMI